MFCEDERDLKEYETHRLLRQINSTVQCMDCGRVHKEIFRIQGTKEDVYKMLKKIVSDVNFRMQRQYGN
jgi:uncharacterized Zn finger protein